MSGLLSSGMYGKALQYVTSHPGQLSLAVPVGRDNQYEEKLHYMTH